MIDLHCHILPALDDGALDLEDAVAMARGAEDDGIAVVCATPHIRHDHDVVIGDLHEMVRELSAELESRSVATRVVTGGEVAETAVGGLDDHELRAVSLGGGGRWILLEPAPGPLGESLDAAVAELSARGYRSVIAHPERHLSEDLEDRLARLVGRGALVQVTAAMLEHEHAAPVIVDFARRGLVHLLGSDAHSSRGGRPVRLSRGLEALRDAEPVAPHLDWISRQAPAAILRGEDVEPPFALTGARSS
ncbi:MAG TPA: CpsB/CapC family capsule biosynthesis tyrosine phosphatase [Thermoleophilaceae bacterium]|nr:CpsB/CapC family capsule biosynthesis tyrosine phosphatase [Thermoleophilaceae bacterium]